MILQVLTKGKGRAWGLSALWEVRAARVWGLGPL